jgi:hypothetical protein
MDDVIIQELWDPEQAAQVRQKIGAVKPTKVDRQNNLEKLSGVHDSIGSWARLAHVANEDPKWFYGRWLDRLLPNEKQELDVNVHIHPALPRSTLDGEYAEVIPDGSGNGADGPAQAGDTLSQGGTPYLIGSPTGPEDTSSEDGCGGAFEQPAYQETGGTGSRS